MSKTTKRRKKYRYYRRRRLKRTGLWKSLVSKLVSLSIFLLTLVLVVYGLSLFTKLHRPGIKPQEELVFSRTQILNASHRDEAVGLVTERLSRMKADNVAHQIVDVGELRSFQGGESMILDRSADAGQEKPSRLALLTAQALGIPARNVVCKPLKDNYQAISLTIVIGNDWQVLSAGI
jgi:hypothetical protein